MLFKCTRGAYRSITIRLNKEKTLYRKENEAQQIKLDKFIAAKAEDWDINNGVRVSSDCMRIEKANTFNQRRMLEESERMIKDSTTRLGQAVLDLRALIVCHCYRLFIGRYLTLI